MERNGESGQVGGRGQSSSPGGLSLCCCLLVCVYVSVKSCFEVRFPEF